ncbi:GtrA family protein [Mobiluncus mulieris]|uniref:GtrA family protein n=1 Tax=Mobiluncus mulieris TaxID=2052 RepID=A0A378PC05_9ACTO|nr:GtrA family protein [Mobiluncus mulieris]MCU9968622.1 GtrA family protein [Mobiluncus mulieris]MCU9972857.1 GtrA family protein [Mobiluncus mulieris]MCU9975064.1 GtrA family protein [Mobiluncus mulieris]MCU9995630.1 GtrA family protein [Mobiluncus mulieris]MCV0009869.1 GtrA family protein [Mobiluncus mulieris]
MKRLNDTQIQALKFTLLSLSAGLVEAGSFALMELLFPFWPYWAQHGVSLTLSVIWNFTLNRRYTFKSAGNIPRAMLLVAAFYAVFIPATMWGGELAARGFVVAGLGKGGADAIVKIATMLLNFVLEFVWWKFVVFRGTENTNDLARRRD